jgi:hypothetical protein
VRKAAQENPSWESFRASRIHPEGEYRYQGDDRPGTHAMSIIRRNPNGELDYEWAKNMVIDAVHNLPYPHALLPIHQALLTVVFPDKYRNMEPMQAAILTQFSDGEKSRVRQMVEAQLKEEENWNAGQGGGSIEGRSVTRNGV